LLFGPAGHRLVVLDALTYVRQTPGAWPFWKANPDLLRTPTIGNALLFKNAARKLIDTIGAFRGGNAVDRSIRDQPRFIETNVFGLTRC